MLSVISAAGRVISPHNWGCSNNFRGQIEGKGIGGGVVCGGGKGEVGEEGEMGGGRDEKKGRWERGDLSA